MCANAWPLYSLSSNTAEIEFLREIKGSIYPIEVKSDLAGKLKSLNIFAAKYPVEYRTRINAHNLELNDQAKMHTYPLYLVSRLPL